MKVLNESSAVVNFSNLAPAAPQVTGCGKHSVRRRERKTSFVILYKKISFLWPSKQRSGWHINQSLLRYTADMVTVTHVRMSASTGRKEIIRAIAAEKDNELRLVQLLRATKDLNAPPAL